MVLLSPPPSSKLKTPCTVLMEMGSWSLTNSVVERVAPVCSLTYVATEKWGKIHSVPLAAGECWSVRFIHSEPNFQYTLREDGPNVCVSLFIRNGWWNWKRWSSSFGLAVSVQGPHLKALHRCCIKWSFVPSPGTLLTFSRAGEQGKCTKLEWNEEPAPKCPLASSL